jgi:hypothetical protein
LESRASFYNKLSIIERDEETGDQTLVFLFQKTSDAHKVLEFLRNRLGIRSTMDPVVERVFVEVVVLLDEIEQFAAAGAAAVGGEGERDFAFVVWVAAEVAVVETKDKRYVDWLCKRVRETGAWKALEAAFAG